MVETSISIVVVDWGIVLKGALVWGSFSSSCSSFISSHELSLCLSYFSCVLNWLRGNQVCGALLTGIWGSSSCSGCSIICCLELYLGSGNFRGIHNWYRGHKSGNYRGIRANWQVGARHTEAQVISHIVLSLSLTIGVNVVVGATDIAICITGLSTVRWTSCIAEGVLAELVLGVVLSLDGGIGSSIAMIA